MAAYTHSNHETPRPLLESKGPRHSYGAKERHQSLNREDDGYDCQFAKLVRSKLRSKLCEDCLNQRVKYALPCQVLRTEAWCEQHDIEIGGELLHLGVEHALSGHDVAWEADAYDLHYGFKDQKYQVVEGWMRRMRRQRIVPECHKGALDTQ